ncbi:MULTISPECIES: hypothetical protein [Planktothricoides]|uniref:Transposase n=2 Tax=Planktothricoides raciborskii TaxID=132608 RepID=A0AAU8JMC9_9CYAN|nr:MULTISPECIES: hypothetical protein [Planktothricoides]MBD2547531.1 hypothetical protein [Planktothricoides raciborskii FACHB-1370]MBD2581566.1 hypothetical protein [Planktothricoides raciborskii FACHB-1261]
MYHRHGKNRNLPVLPKKTRRTHKSDRLRTFQETVTAADLGEVNRIQPHTIETGDNLGVKSFSSNENLSGR